MLILILVFLVCASPAHAGGLFGPVFSWPIIPIHMALLPNGQVESFGTDASGNQGALIRDIWTPGGEHETLQNTIQADLFCAAQTLIAGTSRLLIAGGSLTINGRRNYSRNSTIMAGLRGMVAGPPMEFARWYSSMVALPDGSLAVFGGREDPTPTPVTVPEIYFPGAQSWQTEWGAESAAAFGIGIERNNWWYPKAFVVPGGDVVVLTNDGGLFSVDLSQGTGSISQLPASVPAGAHWFPSVQYSPGHLLSLRNSGEAVTIDLTQSPPVVEDTQRTSLSRVWASLTLLPDGQILMTGGTAQNNVLIGVATHASLWNPDTGRWTVDATYSLPLSYHSNALLLSDASVLITAGGAPNARLANGQQIPNLLAGQIYYPPYLFNTDGSWADRPSVQVSEPQDGKLLISSNEAVSKAVIARLGSATHSYNSDQRVLDLPLTPVDGGVEAALPSDSPITVPGFYLVFAFVAGVPSMGQVILLAHSPHNSI